jgi:hypothetical protein
MVAAGEGSARSTTGGWSAAGFWAPVLHREGGFCAETTPIAQQIVNPSTRIALEEFMSISRVGPKNFHF